MAPIHRVSSLGSSGTVDVTEGGRCSFENSGGFNRRHRRDSVIGFIAIIGRATSRLVIGGKVGGQACIAQLRFAILAEGAKADYRASRLKVVGGDSHDSNIVKVVWLEASNGNSGFLARGIAD